MIKRFKIYAICFAYSFAMGNGFGAALPPVGQFEDTLGNRECYVPPPFLMVHGLTSSAWSWKNTVVQNGVRSWDCS